MSTFRSIVFTALAAGLIVGLVVTLAQQISTVPLILHGEQYEQAEPAHDHAMAGAPGAMAMAEHGHDDGGWSPTDGLERNAFTFLANVLTGVGFALLLTGAFVLRGRPVTWREGLLWGLAGFVVFTVAPDLGLPPELPGIAAADLTARQIWWIGTAAATAAGLGLITLQRTLWAAVLGVALLIVPHLIGAPSPPEVPTAVPDALLHDFVVAVTVTTFLFWTLLGGLTGALYRRFSDAAA